MTQREKFVYKVKKAARKKDPYVWGGQGQKLRKLNLMDLCKMEENIDNLCKVVRYVHTLYYNNVDMTKCKIFDCSGLPTYILMKMGLLGSDTNAQGLYNICKLSNYNKPCSEAQPGDLLFRGNTNKSIVHVGVYIGDMKVIEAKGRAYGVCETDYSSGGWGFCGDIIAALTS